MTREMYTEYWTPSDDCLISHTPPREGTIVDRYERKCDKGITHEVVLYKYEV